MSVYPTNTATTSAMIIDGANADLGGEAQGVTFLDMHVTVRGDGQSMLMIPGLNSAAAVWAETSERLLSAGVQCHLVQLPGFAGLPAAPLSAQSGFMDSMRDRLLTYICAKNLHEPVLVGHSQGGIIALKMALKAPDRIGRLIIVDALPFWPAAQAPNSTVESVGAMAEEMRRQMLEAPEDLYQSRIKANLVGMTHSDERLMCLEQWGRASDRWTTVQAMYEMYITDLRASLADIRQPTLVLASWAEFAAFGSTRASVRQTFAEQYHHLKNVRIELSETGYHFLMWDDEQWLAAQIKQFIAADRTHSYESHG